ncbi:RNA polymerase factor sigma-54 [Accumulibacter sp.]|uniref:RNA polymerase factor sigma-54 n=1 Tax=Accumulibacter sp. TaxID=2053492 RepID=UPI0025DC178B|nr:RNA polymerase factor sigma-54 [Accumulibacter sp.]MCM8610621.1 RNA polymerase factor sigma-54 [Accumulibacter sp.]MCM8634541.1 RNA polymerase factor sigma-54 [Accumulibacter sp.]MCM8641784.1 RNA polymerase factor sigma-54 [Accumulibacter sp.]
MKPSLTLKLTQHLALTPQLQQSIRLLQLSTVELEHELEKFLQENPLLERAEDYPQPAALPADHADAEFQDGQAGAEPSPAPSTSDEDGWADDHFGSTGAAGSFDGDEDDDTDYQDVQAAAVSLRDHLLWQLALTSISARDRILVSYLIDILDDDGYLSQPLEEIALAMPEDLDVGLEELQIALRYLQNLDPTGVGARSAQECLTLQLAATPPTMINSLAQEIVLQHLDLLASHDFARLKKQTGADDEALRAAHLLICSLNPRPGAAYASTETRYIVPDVVVRKLRGQWSASINAEAFPRLRINSLYAQILSRQRGSGLSVQLQEARWLIRNVQQRFDTILRVAQAIVERQRQFLEHGEVAMRPLVLREIAETVGLHESTISRVTTQKYMATPRGIFELKYFFGSHVGTETGGACSATAIRALIKQMIATEEPTKPLSDGQISEVLGQQGIVVARRTIAKYRESLNIPPVSLRKSI